VLEAQTCSYVTSNGAIKRDHVRHHKGVYKRWGCTLRPCDIIPQSGMCQCSHKLFDYKLWILASRHNLQPDGRWHGLFCQTEERLAWMDGYTQICLYFESSWCLVILHFECVKSGIGSSMVIGFYIIIIHYL
jgi:hypothetical protein